MSITGAVECSSSECRRSTEKIMHPFGEIQTFEPRPRPATCVVAANVRPFGRRDRSVGFLGLLVGGEEGLGDRLVEHGVCAGYCLAVEHECSKLAW